MNTDDWPLLEFGRWRLLIDPAATRKAHELITIGSTEKCGCCYCRNFAAARVRVYPSEIIELMHQLGVNPCRETEIYQIGRLRPGWHLYGGFFHFVGKIESEGDTVGPFDIELGDEVPFRMFFANGSLLLPPSFGNQIVTQLEFFAHVPWVLDEPEPD